MKKISGIFLALLTFFSSTLNVFADTIEVIEEKTQTINKDDYESLKNEVEQKVYEYNQQEDGYVYDYEISIKEEKDEVIVTDTKKVTSEKKFTSEEEAKKYYDEYELEDSWKQGELTITSKQEDVVVNGDTITITCEDSACTKEMAALEEALNEYEELEVISKNTTSKNDIKTIVYSVNGKEQELLYEDALKLIVTLNPEVEGYKLVKNESVLVKKGSIDAKTFKEIVGKDTYETYEEAKKATEKFLNSEDYEDKVAVIVAVYDESEKQITKDQSIGFLNEELAWTAAIAEATTELERAIEEGKITINTTIEEAKKALEKAYETGKLGLTGMELDGKIIYFSIPEQRLVETVENIDQKFTTKTAAELAKLALETAATELAETGITIEDIQLVETGEDVTIATESVKQTKIKGSYVLVPTDLTYYSIRLGNKIAFWTTNALSAQQKEDITKSIKENDETVTVVKFINGYNDFDLSDLGSEWSTSNNFKKEVKSIPFVGNITSYSLVIANESSNTVVGLGAIQNGKEYRLTAKMVTATELWYYDRTEIKYGFDYVVEGGGAEITRDLFKVQSILAGKIYTHTMAYRVNTTDTYTSYVASFDIYKEATKTNATVEYKITREKAATGNVTPEEEEQITPPNTGAESNLFVSLGLLVLLAGVISLKKLCK